MKKILNAQIPVKSLIIVLLILTIIPLTIAAVTAGPVTAAMRPDITVTLDGVKQELYDSMDNQTAPLTYTSRDGVSMLNNCKWKNGSWSNIDGAHLIP